MEAMDIRSTATSPPSTSPVRAAMSLMEACKVRNSPSAGASPGEVRAGNIGQISPASAPNWASPARPSTARLPHRETAPCRRPTSG